VKIERLEKMQCVRQRSKQRVFLGKIALQVSSTSGVTSSKVVAGLAAWITQQLGNARDNKRPLDKSLVGARKEKG
jgi:hypothetical protein